MNSFSYEKTSKFENKFQISYRRRVLTCPNKIYDLENDFHLEDNNKIYKFKTFQKNNSNISKLYIIIIYTLNLLILFINLYYYY